MITRARGNFVTLVAGDIATRPAHIGHGQLDEGHYVPIIPAPRPYGLKSFTMKKHTAPMLKW
jgi:hypothetical protein